MPLRYHLAMASATALSIAEYHDTNYRPDREYIDGELRERNVGKREHARTQALLAAWFVQHETAWSAFALTEQRVLVSPNRVRIPDVLLTSTEPQTETLTCPPILVVEILSPEDTYSDTQERARDYLNMGVEMVWVIDPKSRTGRMCKGDIWQEARTLRVPGTPIHIDLDSIFQHLTELRG